jgi:hypothetical protein
MRPRHWQKTLPGRKLAPVADTILGLGFVSIYSPYVRLHFGFQTGGAGCGTFIADFQRRGY